MNIQTLVHSFIHVLITAVAFGIPLILMQGGSWQSLTIGGVLAIVGNWAKLNLSK